MSEPNFQDMYDRAVEIATKAHEGQTRWGGEPYITHPLAVADSFKLLGYEKVAAVLHDVLEDSDLTEDGLRDEFPDSAVWQFIVTILTLLTHQPGESYADYIMRIRTDPNARRVKKADINHNLSDLAKDPRKHKQRRDKYQLALKLLELP